MTCRDCEAAQKARDKGLPADEAEGEAAGHFYVRVGAGNVELVGCRQHVADAIRLIRRAQHDIIHGSVS